MDKNWDDKFKLKIAPLKIYWSFWIHLRLIRECFFYRGVKHPPKISATQTYGQGPAGTLTIGFEEQVKV